MQTPQSAIKTAQVTRTIADDEIAMPLIPTSAFRHSLAVTARLAGSLRMRQNPVPP
jgi:hypothetical protein